MGTEWPAAKFSLWITRPSRRDAEMIHRFFMGSGRLSSEQDLLQLRVVAGEFLVRLAQLLRLAARVQHRGVVAAAEGLPDLGQALLRELLGERHGDLAR